MRVTLSTSILVLLLIPPFPAAARSLIRNPKRVARTADSRSLALEALEGLDPQDSSASATDLDTFWLEEAEDAKAETRRGTNSDDAEGAGAAPRFVLSRPREVSPFPVVLNRTVRRFVDAYLEHSAGLELSFRRSGPFLSEMVQLLESRGVPSDFVYLAFAESGFSGRGAGPWQLTKTTARRFGLRIDRYVDERRDPIKSTRAAAEFLAALHEQVGDWRLAVVGWNRGEASIDRFIRLKGADYDRMATSLPRRTRTLLNRFMAVAFIAHNARAYGIEPTDYSGPLLYQRVKVAGGMLLKKVAEMAETTVEAIRRLNPALLRDRVPPGSDYEVLVPGDNTARYDDDSSDDS